MSVNKKHHVMHIVFRKIYAVEIDVKRFGTLCSFIEKTQSSCIEAINQDALTLDPQRYSQVEYILVDPSCSGSGKNPLYSVITIIFTLLFLFIFFFYIVSIEI